MTGPEACSPHVAAPVGRPRRVRLRAWQSEALGKLEASTGPDFLAVATPGAGKTTFALTAAVQHLADHPGRAIVVVAPTRHLKGQWAAAASQLGLHLEPHWSAEAGLPADMHGIVTTYQQVARSSRQLATLARGAFVVLDEIHHAGDDRTWGSAVLEAFDGAHRRLSLSGTPFRSDSAAIPFVEYHLDEARADYEYGYGEALADRGVVRPVYFPRVGGFMEWVSPDGEVLEATFDDDLAVERANQRLRTALSLEGNWLPTVLEQADAQLGTLRADHPEAGGLVIATDVEHAAGIAALLGRRSRSEVVVATSDDPSASARISEFARGTQRWIVAVRMVSEGVDIPRLRVVVHATTTTTELFFRQAVGRVVRHLPGLRRQKAYVFIPDDPRLRRHATSVAESRRHSLERRAERRQAGGFDESHPRLGDVEEQLSMFSVIGAVATEAGTDDHGSGVFGADPEDPDDHDSVLAGPDPPGVEVLLLPPPLPGGGRAGRASAGEDAGPGARPGETLAQRKARLRQANADIAMELVRASGWGHAQVNRELNRLAGIDAVGAATLGELARRLEEGQRWLRRT